MKTKILFLKLIEILIYISSFFIILYDLILTKKYSDIIYNFGIEKFTFIIFSVLILCYILLIKDEKEYIKEMFNKKRLLNFAIALVFILLIYFI
jgi:hypothetical protein